MSVSGKNNRMGDSKEEINELELEELQKKSKRVFFYRFKKVKGTLLMKKKLKGVSANSESLRRRDDGGCYFCLKQPLTSDSSGEFSTFNSEPLQKLEHCSIGYDFNTEFVCREVIKGSPSIALFWKEARVHKVHLTGVKLVGCQS